MQASQKSCCCTSPAPGTTQAGLMSGLGPHCCLPTDISSLATFRVVYLTSSLHLPSKFASFRPCRSSSIVASNAASAQLLGMGGGLFLGHPNFSLAATAAYGNSAFLGGGLFLATDLSAVGPALANARLMGNRAAGMGHAAFWCVAPPLSLALERGTAAWTAQPVLRHRLWRRPCAQCCVPSVPTCRLRPLTILWLVVFLCRLRSKSPSAYFVCQGGCLDASQAGSLATEALAMELGQCEGRAGPGAGVLPLGAGPFVHTWFPGRFLV